MGMTQLRIYSNETQEYHLKCCSHEESMQQHKMQQQGTTSVSISCLCVTFGINCQMLNPVGLQMTLVVSALVNSRTLPLSISMVRLSTQRLC